MTRIILGMRAINQGAAPTAADATPRKRSLTVNGHRTSVALEPPFWRVLEALAAAEGASMNALVSRVDAVRATLEPMPSLSSLLRVYALQSAQALPLADTPDVWGFEAVKT